MTFGLFDEVYSSALAELACLHYIPSGSSPSANFSEISLFF